MPGKDKLNGRRDFVVRKTGMGRRKGINLKRRLLKAIGFLKMSPSDIKQAQHKRYDEKAAAVVRGELGYKPAEKSRYSKSCKLSSKHVVSFPDAAR